MSQTGHGLAAEPCTLVIFGGSGDLAKRKLVPAVYNLLLDGVLPPHYAILGLGRKPLSDEEFRAGLRDGITKYSRQKLADDTWKEFEAALLSVGRHRRAQDLSGHQNALRKNRG
jgi:glucose-6-phosphate 1-dehydrogenase